MQIQNRETGYKKINNATAFKGLPVAKIRLKNLPACDEITIIQLSKEDLPFLNKMFEKINLEKMYPNLPEKKDFNKWKDIPGIVAGLAGTHDFDIHIEGLVQNGVIK